MTLPDIPLLLIFGQCSLNTRANVRLACKRFRQLCDELKIEKLVIQERNKPIVPGTLQSGEPYSEEHAVNCFSLQQFFDSPILREQLRSLRVLVIHGDGNTDGLALTVEFKLRYLELHRIGFASSSIMNSPQLEHLILDRPAFAKVVAGDYTALTDIGKKLTAKYRKMPTEWLMVSQYGFDSLQSKQLRYLNLSHLTDQILFQHCVRHGLLRSIEHMELVLLNLGTLKYLSENCPSLKRIDFIARNLDQLVQLNQVALPGMLRRLRKDLKVYAFGVPMHRHSDPVQVTEMLNELSELATPNEEGSGLTITLDLARAFTLYQLNKTEDLSEFYKLIDTVDVAQEVLASQKLFLKFIGCKTLLLQLLNNPVPSFKNLAAAYTRLDTVVLRCEHQVRLGSDVFNFLKQNRLITYLFLENYQKINDFRFLLDLPRLKELGLCLFHPIEHELILELIKRLPLNFLDITCIRPASLSKEQLSAFKQRVIREAGDRIQARQLYFKITIHTKADKQIVRYHLKTVRVIGEYPLFDEERIFGQVREMQKLK